MQHPAVKKLRAIIKKAGFKATEPYSHTFKVMGDNAHPVYIYLEHSCHENKSRIIVDGLCDQSDKYVAVRDALNRQVIVY